jgi:hypothetical protein
MERTYRSKSPLSQEAPQAMVIYCSAARYQQHFEEFLTEGLKLENYSLLAIPGGVQVLAWMDYLPKFSWAVWRWSKFLVDADHPPRIVLIAHEECRWYKGLRFWESGQALNERMTSDLRRVRQSLQERFAKTQVDLYYARVDPQNHVLFEAL